MGFEDAKIQLVFLSFRNSLENRILFQAQLDFWAVQNKMSVIWNRKQLIKSRLILKAKCVEKF